MKENPNGDLSIGELGLADEIAVWSRDKAPHGRSVAVALVNPMLGHNVGAAVRAASCFGAQQVWWTGNRVTLDPSKGERLPREERMKGYKKVELIQYDHFFDQFPRDITPVAVERREKAESLVDFIHPERALYVFGPEDGSLAPVHLQHCHRFVVIPTEHCLNLAAAVNVVLYDRMMKERRHGP
jgi:tRNA(Leu) C34 or U34 (ribose-2'-O)-methylase TrmL